MKTTIKLIVVDENDTIIDYFRFDYMSERDLNKAFMAAFTHLQSPIGVCVQNNSGIKMDGKVLEVGAIPFWYPQPIT